MPIDTGNLSNKTYKAIMPEAEKFNHDLTLQFGLLSYQCKNGKEFIKKSQMRIKEMLHYNKYELDGMFFGNPPLKKDFDVVLKKIENNIKNL